MDTKIINQLDRVICEIRFQPILSINSSIGSFQEAIRDKYPIYSFDQSVKIVNMDVHNFTFTTIDNKWTATLSMNALSLTTTSYTIWEDFFDRFKFILDAFVKCFNAKSIVRVGLRYINAIRPSTFEKDCTIDSLIAEKYRSFLHSDLGDIINTNTLVEVKIDTETICRSSFGLIRFTNNNELGFKIDNDVITIRPSIKITEIDEILSKNNGISRDLFLMMTTEKIHREVGQ